MIDDGKTFIDKVDVILANEPFGLKNITHAECCERIKELKIRGTKAEPLFLQLMMLLFQKAIMLLLFSCLRAPVLKKQSIKSIRGYKEISILS